MGALRLVFCNCANGIAQDLCSALLCFPSCYEVPVLQKILHLYLAWSDNVMVLKLIRCVQLGRPDPDPKRNHIGLHWNINCKLETQQSLHLFLVVHVLVLFAVYFLFCVLKILFMSQLNDVLLHIKEIFYFLGDEQGIWTVKIYFLQEPGELRTKCFYDVKLVSTLSIILWSRG